MTRHTVLCLVALVLSTLAVGALASASNDQEVRQESSAPLSTPTSQPVFQPGSDAGGAGLRQPAVDNLSPWVSPADCRYLYPDLCACVYHQFTSCHVFSCPEDCLI
jgi:hypothetical protein